MIPNVHFFCMSVHFVPLSICALPLTPSLLRFRNPLAASSFTQTVLSYSLVLPCEFASEREMRNEKVLQALSDAILPSYLSLGNVFPSPSSIFLIDSNTWKLQSIGFILCGP